MFHLYFGFAVCNSTRFPDRNETRGRGQEEHGADVRGHGGRRVGRSNTDSL